jgi:hypothetical protein
MSASTGTYRPVPISSSGASFDVRRALRRAVVILVVIAVAYAAMIVLSTALAYANALPTSAGGKGSLLLPGWLALVALLLSTLAGQLRLLLPLVLPALTAVVSGLDLNTEFQQPGVNELLPRNLAIPYFRVAFAIGLFELIAVGIILSAGFFYVAAGHRWADRQRATMTGLFFGLVLIAVAASALILLRG